MNERLSAALADRYRLERELGQGGMATVYLAADLKHDRQVAIKVLRPELAAVLGADRFVQEIKTTAALQHPHILPLFDSGQADSFLYYVMPYIQGETLRTKLDREKQLGVDEAVKIAREVADALDYAHRQGVIHRDIKPENILLHDGRPMVADFGIALAVSAAAGGRMTETGLSLGTPHYMSPEQATAEKEITARSDVYSLASVLYEMLSGNPPHTGASAQQIIMKIIAEPVPTVTSLRRSVPVNVAAALAKALEKLPADRFESAKGFADALENPHFTLASGAIVPGLAAGGRRRFGPVPLAAVGVAGMLLGIGGARLARPRVAAAPATRFYLAGDSTHRITPNFALSPDGTVLVYAANTPNGTQLFQQRLSELDPRPIPGTTDALAEPFMIVFSPDGSMIAYATASALKRVELDGADPRTLTALHGTFGGGAWGPDGSIVYTDWPDSVLYRVPADGGAAVPIPIHGDSGLVLPVLPSLLPGGRLLLCQDEGRIGVVDLATGALRRVAVGVGQQFVAPGTLVYGRTDGSIVAQPFDPDRGDTTGPAKVLVQGVASFYGSLLDFNVAATGVLSYLPVSPGGAQLRLVPGAVLSTGSRIWVPRVSPDGRRIVYGAYASGGSLADLWIYDLGTRTDQRLTSGGQTGADYNDGTWSPDGRWLALSAIDSTKTGGGKGLYLMPSDGSAAPELVLSLPGNQFPTGWTPDGRNILFTSAPPQGPNEIWMVPAFGDHRPVLLVQSAYGARGGRVSPDGRWLAFEADETGQPEVYIQHFPAGGVRVRVSESGGRMPVWSRDGRQLFYWNRDQLLVARLQPAAEISVIGRSVYADLTIPSGTVVAQYDVMPDGRVVASTVPAASSRLAVVTDFRTPVGH